MALVWQAWRRKMAAALHHERLLMERDAWQQLAFSITALCALRRGSKEPTMWARLGR